MRFCDCIIEGQRLYRGFLCLRHRFVRRCEIVKCQSSVAIRQSDISKSKIRVPLDRLLELSDCLFYSVRGALVPKISSPQVKLVRLRVCAVAFDKPALFFAGKLQLQLLCDLTCNCLFDCNHIATFTLAPSA